MTDKQFIQGQEIAELLELTPQRVSAMTQQGILIQDGKGRYPLRESMHRICRWYRERLGEGKTKAAVAKQRSQELQVEILEESLKRTRGETISIEAAKRVSADVVLKARQAFMKLGDKLANRVPYLKDEAAIAAEIDKAVGEILFILSRPVEYVEDSEPESEAA